MLKSERVEHGFTLIELLLVVSILGIVASIAAPNITSTVANQTMKSEETSVRSLLEIAKAESNIRRQNITVTITPAAGTTPAAFSVTDVKGDVIASHTVDGNTTLLSTPAITQIIFASSGRIQVAGNPSSVSLAFCNSSITAEMPRTIDINANTRLSYSRNGSCT